MIRTIGHIEVVLVEFGLMLENLITDDDVQKQSNILFLLQTEGRSNLNETFHQPLSVIGQILRLHPYRFLHFLHINIAIENKFLHKRT